ncbi:c-type heme family protein [Crateriforma conspicua]|uniref:c-type heme family protein n=1 Tax=Crateriforma conspicua TaxID=2527996 RepID=UPI00118A383F|nr:DUF3365 domain-containing protein [Crateriforma conspicua]QDV62552.1 hypothetical protein Mal65_16860 [Crateriforma conspicua]
MIRRCILIATVLTVITLVTIANDQEAQSNTENVAQATSIVEARSRAKMLHELVCGTLQIMHRDFFDEDNAHAIPSASLEDVFHEMGDSYDVKMKWLIINTDVVNVDHEPETPFEKDAVKLLAAGKPFAEHTTSNRYHFAGPIRLGSQCLKCHVKRRTSNEDRTAGLVITMPLRSELPTAASTAD